MKWTAYLTMAGLLAAALNPANAETLAERLVQRIAPKKVKEDLAPKIEEHRQGTGIEAVEDEAQVPVMSNDELLNPRSGGMSGLASSNRGQSLDLGMESEDAGNIINIFDNPEIRRMLGVDPRFVYDTMGQPDPMLVPWVRNMAIFQELSAAAEELKRQGAYDQALALYQRLAKMNDHRFADQILANIDDLKEQIQVVEQQEWAALNDVPEDIEEEDIVLPPWVEDNTFGVLLIEDGAPMCIVGSATLSVGDAVPEFDHVTVVGIEESKVTYEIRGKQFEVEIKLPI